MPPANPQDRPADWNPSLPLRADATDAQMKARQHEIADLIYEAVCAADPEGLYSPHLAVQKAACAIAREFAAASLAARVPADWREDKQVTNARSTLIRDATYAHVPDAYQMAALLALPLDALCDAVAACATQQEEKR
jgi:hypothetical protein